MDKDAVWATDIEIVAVASLLITPIEVHTEDLRGQRRGMKYNPVCIVPPFKTWICMIYLTNYREHFNRVVNVGRLITEWSLY